MTVVVPDTRTVDIAVGALDALSVVIPSYNGGQWLEETVGHIVASIAKAGIVDYEIIIVDDGSTDDTAKVVAALHDSNERVIHHWQENSGRLPARRAGLAIASKPYVLLIDSRVHIHRTALTFVKDQLVSNPERRVWNSHVEVDLGMNLYMRFWTAVTFLAWRKYLRRPKLATFGPEKFDQYPKGTTMFLAPRDVLTRYVGEFRSLIENPRLINDDTGFLRALASEAPITIAPEFSCTYHYGRSTVRGFFRHTYNRGTVFVDGFLRPGNRYFWPLIACLILSIIGVVAAPFYPEVVGLMLGSGWLGSVGIMLAAGVPAANALAFFIVLPLFAVAYGLGIWRGAILVAQAKIGASVGARASTILLMATLAAGGGNYLYNLICIRWLGTERYAEVSAITALSMIVLLPFSCYQTTFAREAAQLIATGEDSKVASILRSGLARSLRIQLVVCVGALAVIPLMMSQLHLDDAWLAFMLMPLVMSATILPITQGVLQGSGRFIGLAVDFALLGVLRPIIAIPLILVAGELGALSANAVSATAAVALALWLLRGRLLDREAAPASIAAPDTGTVLIGLLAFASITNADLLVAKAQFRADTVGEYASAILVGKAAAYLAAAVSMVLLTHASARVARGESAVVLLRKTLVVIASLGLVGSGLLALVPTSLVISAFGEQFAGAQPLLAPAGIVMTLCGLVNAVLIYTFAHRDRWFSWLLAVVAVLHASAMIWFGASPERILSATAAVSVLVLLIFVAVAVCRGERFDTETAGVVVSHDT